MPFCEPCARHWTPSAMNADGSCPTCGLVLAKPRLAESAERATPPAKEGPKAPWHFKLLLFALVVYLGVRAVQGLGWVAERL